MISVQVPHQNLTGPGTSSVNLENRDKQYAIDICSTEQSVSRMHRLAPRRMDNSLF